MKKILAIILSLLMLLSMIACTAQKKEDTATDPAPAAEQKPAEETSTPEASPPAEEEEKTFNIAVSLMNIDAFMSYVAEGAENYGKDNANVKVTVYDAKGNANDQLTTIENVLAQGVDAIVITPVDTDATAPITQMCEEYGVPLVATNAKCSSKTTTFVGSDNLTSGKQETQCIVDLLDGKGNVVILAGNLASQNGRDRLTGAHEILDSLEDMSILAEQAANWSRAEAMEITENWLQSGMEIDAIIAGNDEMAIGAALACEELGVEIPIVGVGGTVDGLNAVLNGQIYATVFWNGFQQGYVGVEAAVRALNGEELPEYIDIETALVYKDTAEEYLALFN